MAGTYRVVLSVSPAGCPPSSNHNSCSPWDYPYLFTLYFVCTIKTFMLVSSATTGYCLCVIERCSVALELTRWQQLTQRRHLLRSVYDFFFHCCNDISTIFDRFTRNVNKDRTLDPQVQRQVQGWVRADMDRSPTGSW